jgi:hypothetical protein
VHRCQIAAHAVREGRQFRDPTHCGLVEPDLPIADASLMEEREEGSDTFSQLG